MRSPFPGMDPFLENPAFWRDFHSRYINYLCEALAERLPDNYEARIGERVSLIHRAFPPSIPPRGDYPPRTVKRIGPDVTVTRRKGPEPARASASGVATLEPVTVPNVVGEEVGETYIEIRRRPDRTLVTALELLSPANKEESDRGAYLQKRDALLRQQVHLFELDFLLGGERLPFERPLPPGDYYALLSRADRRPDCDVYAWSVREPLPVLPVPLRSPDPDVLVDLGAVMAMAYDRGRYARSLDYGSPLKLAVPEETRRWLEERARAASA